MPSQHAVRTFFKALVLVSAASLAASFFFIAKPYSYLLFLSLVLLIPHVWLSLYTFLKKASFSPARLEPVLDSFIILALVLLPFSVYDMRIFYPALTAFFTVGVYRFKVAEKAETQNAAQEYSRKKLALESPFVLLLWLASIAVIILPVENYYFLIAAGHALGQAAMNIYLILIRKLYA